MIYLLMTSSPNNLRIIKLVTMSLLLLGVSVCGIASSAIVNSSANTFS